MIYFKQTVCALIYRALKKAWWGKMRHVKTFAYSALAGVCIAVGGTLSLLLNKSAFFFTVGPCAICFFGLHLFNDKVCEMLRHNKDYAIDLSIIWSGNLVGTWIIGFLERQTSLAANLMTQAQTLCDIKMNDSLLSLFILAFLCNIVICLTVFVFQNNSYVPVRYLAVFFGTLAFVISDFEHCVADMYYFSVAGMWSLRTLSRVLIITLGNSVGGIIIPLSMRIFNEKKISEG